MTKMRILAASVLAASIAGPASAEEIIKDTLYLTPSVAFGLFDHKNDVSETVYLQLGAQYRFLPNWAIEGVYGRGKADWDTKTTGNREYRDYRVDGFYYFGAPARGFQPYVSTGLGRSTLDSADQTRMNLGGGFRYVVNNDVSFNIEAREFFGFDHDTFDTQASFGLSWAFNRMREPAPMPVAVAPAPAPAPAPVVPQDDDNDGVPNDRDQCPQTKPGAKVDANGCEGKKAVLETIRLNVKFPTASHEISAVYDSEIRKVADFLRKFPDTTVEIEGHTDSTGGYEMNKGLSNRRANSVRERLIKHHGIAAERITAVGYGPDKPVASNETAAGRAQNRRVDARMEKVVE